MNSEQTAKRTNMRDSQLFFGQMGSVMGPRTQVGPGDAEFLLESVLVWALLGKDLEKVLIHCLENALALKKKNQHKSSFYKVKPGKKDVT